MKTCFVCKTEKPVDAFSKNKRETDGLQANCKACAKAYRESYRANNPEKVQARNAALRAANREKLRLIQGGVP